MPHEAQVGTKNTSTFADKSAIFSKINNQKGPYAYHLTTLS